MSIDSHTAGLLLKCLEKENNTPETQDDVYKLYKEMNENQRGGPTPEAIAFVEQNINKPCKVNHTDYEGIIVGLNTATAGFNPGFDSPVYVKITKNLGGDPRFDCAVGKTYEYPLEQVEVIED